MTYEDICSNPVGRVKALFDFANLRWDRQMEQFIAQSIQGQCRAGVFQNPQTDGNWSSIASRPSLTFCSRPGLQDIGPMSLTPSAADQKGSPSFGMLLDIAVLRTR